MSTLTLNHPITFAETTITTVTFHRARVKDIEAIQSAVETEGELAASIVTIARLTGLSVDEVREIDGEDFVRIAEKLPDFLPRLEIGSTGAQS